MLDFNLMKWYISATLLITLISLIGLGIIVFQFDPDTAPINIRVLFFFSFFLALWGLGTLMALLLSLLLKKGLEGISRRYLHIKAAEFSAFFRRGLLFASGVLGIIFLRWWKGPDSFFPGIAILLLVMIEMWSIQRSRTKTSTDKLS